MAEEETEPYQVIVSKNERQKLRRWGEWAKQQGVLKEFLIALRTINFRLSFEPMDWGEPKYTLQHLGLRIRFGTETMLNVWYGVHQERRLVFVKVFQFRGDYPPGQPPEDS